MIPMAHKILLGPAGTPTVTKGGTLEAVGDVARLGLKAMEVEFVYGVRMGMGLARQVGREAGKHDIALSIHAPYYVNLCTDDAKKLAASKKRIADSVERADAMEARVVVFHPGFYGKLEKKEALERVLDACKDMAGSVPSGVKLGIETTGKSGAFGTLEEVVSVCRKSRACVPVVDFAHIYARQVGNIDYGKVLDEVKPLRLKHLHTHFSNIEYTQKGERNHLPLDHSPPFGPLAKEIMKRKLDVTIICESPALEQDSLRMKRTFERMGHAF
jgi:deoxyribonuclease-4